MPKSLRTLLLALFAATLQAQQPKPPIRVAIVGLEHGHVDGFLNSFFSNPADHANVIIAGIADPDAALRDKYEQKYKLPHLIFFSTEDEMLQDTRPQAILVYTPISEHRRAIEIAAQHGVSVMVEKPLTISLSDAQAIRQTARDHHIQVLVNYETTWYASNRAAYDEVRENRLGPIRRIVVHDGHQGPAEIHVQPEFLNWLTDPEKNGAGALYDFGCYGADLATWLMHGQPPLTVTAVTNRDKPSRYPRVDDDATVILQYPSAQAVLQPSWNWPFSRKDMEVYGATGYAITVETKRLRTRHEHEDSERVRDAQPLPDEEKDSLSYLTAVLTGQVTPKGDLSSLDTNIVVMEILDAARESARTGRTIRLTPNP